MKQNLAPIFVALSLLAVACSGGQTLHIVTTGDVHGSWFDEPYVEGRATRTSLMSVYAWVDSLRQAVGNRNVLLLDAGDCLQGDNASYYYNYVDTDGVHPFVQIVDYMGYDAIAVGNHDIETGHKVYDKVATQLRDRGIPFMGANAVSDDDDSPYFASYKMFRRGGFSVAVIGFTNPNIKEWLGPALWEGMEFESLTDCVQDWVDRVRKKERPDVVVVLTHSGTGPGDGSVLESQGLDLLESLEGVDVLVCSHDHRPYTSEKDGLWLINGGARAGYVGHVVITRKKGAGKQLRGEVVRMDKNKVDVGMKERFRPDFEAVRDFTVRPVGHLDMELHTREAYLGMCDYVNLVHTVQLQSSGAQISFAAPLTFNGTVKSGQVIYDDMFTIYPFENQLYVMKLTGKEIRQYLEHSYDGWIQTPGEHALKIRQEPDARTGSRRWSFEGRTYNFDSAAGLVYTVNLTRPAGQRVQIRSLADGSRFDEDREYTVAMTSYRANGGGEMLTKGIGLDADELAGRIEGRFPEIRELIHQYFKKHGIVDAALVGDRSVIGEWHFVPESSVRPLMQKDLELIF